METCKVCSDPLVFVSEPDEPGDETETFPDDLLLSCGCHFHWQCLHDQSAQVVSTLSCPSCSVYLPPSVAGASAAPAQNTVILTRYTNEGGVQDGLDIFPTVAEEAYLAERPKARAAQALHAICAAGDVDGIIELLADADQPGDDGEEAEAGGLDAAAMLRYQDPLNGLRSAVHVAIESLQEEVFWLLMWLGSGLPADSFPEAVSQAALARGLQKGEIGPGREDIRFLADAQGKTAGDLCAEAGGQWKAFVEGGLFM